MQYLELNETKKHGTDGFPFEYYYIESSHPRYLMNYHWHAEYELIRVLEGTLTVTLNEKSFDMKAGELVFVHGGILHAGVPKDCVYECIVFDLNVFLKQTQASAAYIQRVIDRSAFVYHHFVPCNEITGTKDEVEQKSINRAVEIIRNVFESMAGKKTGYELAVIGGLYQFFAVVFSEHLYLDALPHTSRKDVKRTMQLRRVIDYIDQHIGNQITLSQLAGAASMSPRYFCRFFYQMTHHTPIEYLNLQRIEYACYALSTTDEPVTEVAMNCGFNDLSYFIRIFKRYKGITPGQYRG